MQRPDYVLVVCGGVGGRIAGWSIKTDKNVPAHDQDFLPVKRAHRDYRYECRSVLNKLSERGYSWRLNIPEIVCGFSVSHL
jgi:hypothetical protein